MSETTAAITNEGTTQATATTESQVAKPEATVTDASKDDAKATEAKSETAETEAKAEEKPAGAPEKYDLKLPEGFQKTELLGELEVVAKEANLPQEQAQKFVDLGMKMQNKFIADQQEAIKKLNEDWVAQTKSDKEIGGDKLEQNMAIAKKGLDALATPELKTLLNQTGLGNHPEIIKAFYKAGLKISEDKHITGELRPTPKGNNAAKTLYPDQT